LRIKSSRNTAIFLVIIWFSFFLFVITCAYSNDAQVEKHHDRGIRLYSVGNIDGAIIEFTKAIELNPRFDRAYTNRGIMWQEKGEYDKSIIDCTKAIELNPEQLQAYNARGNTWRFKGDFDKAIADYNKAIALNNNNAILYSNRGTAWANKGDFDRAIADFNKAIELTHRNPMPYYLRGCLLYRQGKFKESLSDFQKAMECEYDPRDYPYLMLLIASQKVSKEELQKYSKDFANFMSRDSSYWWIRKLIVFYLHENTTEEKLISEAERVKDHRKRQEMLCEAYYYLGESRLAKGDKKGAEEYFRKCIETNVFTTVEYLNAKAMLKLISEGKP